MATKAERFHYLEERSGPKKAKRRLRRERQARPGLSDIPRVLESSRTRGQDIRVTRLPGRPGA
jgi:hypothetical protein